ncbi:MAG TPA: AAA family ATPase, partial [Gemmatimonadaceae bacterium]|nr:AAA family ATPase [Gemmatimonadaceae bacterium]
AGQYERPETLVPDVPDDLRRLCEALLHSDPVARATDAEILDCVGEGSHAVDAIGTAAPLTSLLESVPLVGREAELAALEAALAAVSTDGLRVVALHGRSGTGKSAIVQQFLQTCRADADVLVLAGRCYEQESVPFKAIDTLVDALTRRLARLDDDIVRALLPDDIEAAARVFPVLRRVPAIEAAVDVGLQVPEPREVRRRAFHALQALLVTIGHEMPIVIAIDDLQWGDVDSAELLLSLFGTPDRPPPRALVLVAFRSEYRTTSACLQHLLTALADRARAAYLAESVIDLAVPPLGVDAAVALATALLGPAARPATVQRIATESGGNPFFIGELARYTLEQPDWSSTTGRGFDLEDVLARRIARLPAPARALLEVVAIAGQPVSNRHWRDAVDAATRGPGVLAQLRQERLIRSTGVSSDDEVEAYHDRIRETVMARLDPDVRTTWHRRLGDALEQAGDADAETIAVHFVRGGLTERAWPHYRDAARGAARALAFDRAATLFEEALTHHVGPSAERAELLLALGDARANSGRGRPAGEAFEAA